jgi:hypothetical protein
MSVHLTTNEEFSPIYKSSPWLTDFNSYLDSAATPLGIAQGKHVVHSGIAGVAIYLGRATTDHIVLSYGDSRFRAFSTKLDLKSLIRAATTEEIATSGLDATKEVKLFTEILEAERQNKLDELKALEEQEIICYEDMETNVIGYFTPSQVLNGINLEELLDSEVN